MKNVLIIFYTLLWILTWEKNICFSFVLFFLLYSCLLFILTILISILLYFIRMKMMKYDITLLLGDIEFKKLISFTDSP